MNTQFIKIFILATLLFITGVSNVYSIENTFTTSLSVVANDTGAPTIPADLEANVVSNSQIDLAWTASVDDIAVAGYRIYRDSIIIASTTSTTYSDTGLNANTTYTYTVEAYDAVPQYSGESSQASATTLAEPIADVSSSGGSSGSYVLKIFDIVASVKEKFAILNFNTSHMTQVKVFWGKTKDYEIGSSIIPTYQQSYSVKIDDLEQGTSYFFKIEATNSNGYTVREEGIFTTEAKYQYVIPNVLNFRATPNRVENVIQLSWNNPENFDIESIRVVKSDKFYPRDPSEGEVIYEGKNQGVVDGNVEAGKTYYYSVFIKDKSLGYSSGAIAMARIPIGGEVATSTDPFAGITIINNVHPDIAKLTLSDFDFIQDGRKISNVGNTIAIDGSKNLTVILSYDKVPEVLKTIAFSLSDPDDPTSVFPFLLRVNGEKTAYEATIAPLGKSGNYGLNIMILDYKNQGLKKLEGNLKAFVFSTADVVFGGTRVVNTSYLWWLWLIVVVAILYVLGYLNRKRSHEV